VKKRTGVLAAAAATAVVAGAGTAAIAPIDVYADPLVPQYTTVKLISSGDTVPETGDPAKTYQVVGSSSWTTSSRRRAGPSRSSASRSTAVPSSRGSSSAPTGR
jgi:hypothetical protein